MGERTTRRQKDISRVLRDRKRPPPDHRARRDRKKTKSLFVNNVA